MAVASARKIAPAARTLNIDATTIVRRLDWLEHALGAELLEVTSGDRLLTPRGQVVRFNDRGPDGLLDGKGPGKPSLFNGVQRQELKKPGYVKLTARPRHHAQNEYAIEDFKKGGFAA